MQAHRWSASPLPNPATLFSSPLKSFSTQLPISVCFLQTQSNTGRMLFFKLFWRSYRPQKDMFYQKSYEGRKQSLKNTVIQFKNYKLLIIYLDHFLNTNPIQSTGTGVKWCPRISQVHKYGRWDIVRLVIYTSQHHVALKTDIRARDARPGVLNLNH